VIADLARLADFGIASGLASFLVFLRVGGAMLLLPAFGEAQVPRRVRLAVAIAFTLAVTPAVAPELPTPSASAETIGIILSETLVGLCIGFAIRLAALALWMAGVIAAQSTSLSQVFPVAGEPVPAAAMFLVFGGLAVAMAFGLHVTVCAALVRSYVMLPAGALPQADGLFSWAVAQAQGSLSLAFSLAAPFVAGALVYNLALGAINRAMPTLMVSLIGAPALSLSALALMTVAIPVLLSHWAETTAEVMADPLAAPAP
jgi:flagellar biosynthetic protein FliR